MTRTGTLLLALALLTTAAIAAAQSSTSITAVNNNTTGWSASFHYHDFAATTTQNLVGWLPLIEIATDPGFVNHVSGLYESNNVPWPGVGSGLCGLPDAGVYRDYSAVTMVCGAADGWYDFDVFALRGFLPGGTYYVRPYGELGSRTPLDCAAAPNAYTCLTGTGTFAFTTPILPPAAVTLAASGVGGSSANMNGSVLANNINTTWWFEWGTDPTLTVHSDLAGATISAGAPVAWTTQSVTRPLAGLLPSTPYYFRLVAQSTAGLVQGSILSFTTGLLPVLATNPATGITSDSAVLNGTVDPNNISLGWYFQVGTSSGNYTMATAGGTLTGDTLTSVSTSITGLTPNTQYFFRLRGECTGGPVFGEERNYTTPPRPDPVAPSVATGSASNVGVSNATLTGTCNPNGYTAIAWFEWGVNTSYGNTTPAQSAGNGTSPVYISSNLTGLPNGTTFHARIVGQNSAGLNYGNDVAFTTGAENPPTVLTGSSSNIGQTSATVAGQINPNNSAGYWFVEYGPTTSYGLTAFGGNFAAGSSTLNVSTTLSNLSPGAPYNYRFAATNGLAAAAMALRKPTKERAYGTTYGGNATFTTLSAPANAPSVTTGGSTVLSYTSASAEGIVNANNFATNWRFQYGTNPLSLTLSTPDAYAGSGGADLPVSRTLTGLTSGIPWYYRLSASNANGTSVGLTNSFVLGTPSAPTVTTLDASSIAYTGAVLNAIVNMMGDTGSYFFRYGQVPGGPYPLSSTSGAAAGSTDQWVSRAISGLTQGTTYYVVAQATNGGGTTTGNEVQFTTLVQSNPLAPIANTLDPTDVGQTSAKLNGTYNPNNGTNPVVWFEYGTNSSSLDRITSLQPVGTGNAELPYSRSVTGLAADTQYFVRFACRTDTGGTAYGATLSFSTQSTPVTPVYITDWKWECVWKDVFSSKFIGGSGKRGLTRQSIATGTFTGTGVAVIAMKDKTLGRMKVTVTGATAKTIAQAADPSGIMRQMRMRPDGDDATTQTTTVDLHTNGATQYQAKVFTLSGLSPGQHKITLQTAAGKHKNKKVAIFVDEALISQ